MYAIFLNKLSSVKEGTAKQLLTKIKEDCHTEEKMIVE